MKLCTAAHVNQKNFELPEERWPLILFGIIRPRRMIAPLLP